MRKIRFSRYTDEMLDDMAYKISCINKKIEALYDEQCNMFGNLVSIGLRLDELTSKPVIKNKPIKDCNISGLAKGICENAGIKTLFDLAKHSRLDMMKLPNCGKKSIRALETLLWENGLNFRKKGDNNENI